MTHGDAVLTRFALEKKNPKSHYIIDYVIRVASISVPVQSRTAGWMPCGQYLIKNNISTWWRCCGLGCQETTAWIMYVKRLPWPFLMTLQPRFDVRNVDQLSPEHVHYRQKIWSAWKSQWKHSHFTFWLAGNGLAPAMSKDCDSNEIVTCIVMHEKCNFQCRIEIYTIEIYRNISFFLTSPKKFHHFSGIHHYILNLWTLCLYSIIRN